MKAMKVSKQAIYGIIMVFVASAAFADAVPEFDGGYLKTKDGSYKELKAKKMSYTQISKGGISIMALMKQPKTYYVADKKGMISLSANEFKGVTIRGNHKFKYFSLHPLITKKLGKNEGLFENHGPAKKGKPFYTPGKEMEIRSKSLGNSTYYFAPREKLAKGEYVAWLSDTFWLFEVK